MAPSTDPPAGARIAGSADGGLGSIADRLRSGDTVPADELLGLGLPFEQDRFGLDALGLRWDAFALDRVTAHLDADERHHQPYGIVHGGVWCGVVEGMASFGAALRAGLDGQVVVGVANATDFLRPHRRGRADAVAEPVHVGRTQQLWQVVIARADDGKPIARGQVRLHQLPASSLRTDEDAGHGHPPGV